MASTAQLGEKMRLEKHQYSLWQEIWDNASRPTLWLLESRVTQQDKAPVVDDVTGYVMSFVSDNPVTLDVVRPSSPYQKPPSPTVSSSSFVIIFFLALKLGDLTFVQEHVPLLCFGHIYREIH